MNNRKEEREKKNTALAQGIFLMIERLTTHECAHGSFGRKRRLMIMRASIPNGVLLVRRLSLDSARCHGLYMDVLLLANYS